MKTIILTAAEERHLKKLLQLGIEGISEGQQKLKPLEALTDMLMDSIPDHKLSGYDLDRKQSLIRERAKMQAEHQEQYDALISISGKLAIQQSEN